MFSSLLAHTNRHVAVLKMLLFLLSSTALWCNFINRMLQQYMNSHYKKWQYYLTVSQLHFEFRNYNVIHCDYVQSIFHLDTRPQPTDDQKLGLGSEGKSTSNWFSLINVCPLLLILVRDHKVL